MGDTRVAQSVVLPGQGALAVGLGKGHNKTKWILGRGEECFDIYRYLGL